MNVNAEDLLAELRKRYLCAREYSADNERALGYLRYQFEWAVENIATAPARVLALLRAVETSHPCPSALGVADEWIDNPLGEPTDDLFECA